MRVEVDKHQEASVEVRSGEKNGNKWEMRSQPIWLFKDGSKYPIEININLSESVRVYRAGIYELDIESLIVQGNFNRMSIDERNLKMDLIELVK